MTSRKIGIVSGIGAAAGARMLSMLIKECQFRGAKKDSDFPEVVLHSMQSEGLDNTGIVDRATLEMELLSSVAMLNQCRCDVIAVACNTAHLYYNEMQQASRARVLNMVELATEKLDGKRVAVLSSRTTRDTGLYASSLARRRAASIIEASDKDQTEIDNIIQRVIEGKNTQMDFQYLFTMVKKLKKETDAIILGCTELPIVFHQGCIDPTERIIAKVLSL